MTVEVKIIVHSISPKGPQITRSFCFISPLQIFLKHIICIWVYFPQCVQSVDLVTCIQLIHKNLNFSSSEVPQHTQTNKHGNRKTWVLSYAQMLQITSLLKAGDFGVEERGRPGYHEEVSGLLAVSKTHLFLV